MTDGELTKDNMSVAIVGKGTPLTLLEDTDLEPHLAALADEAGGGAACGRLPHIYQDQWQCSA